jgi:hypothetical protein
MAGDGDDAREGGTATWTLVGTVLGMEVPWMERQSAMATLVREHIENSMVEKLVYESVSVRGMVYELVSGEETLMTLGVEVPLLGKSTMATWNLVRIFMVKRAVFLRKRMLEVEETSQTATRTWGNTLGVGEMSTMATIETHSNEAYMDRVGKDKTYMDRVGKLVSLVEMVRTLGVVIDKCLWGKTPQPCKMCRENWSKSRLVGV